MTTGRRRALVFAAAYLAAAWGCVLYALSDPGTYSMNFLVPFLVTLPTSLLAAGVMTALGLSGSAGLAAAVLAGCGLAQAAAVYAFAGRRHG